MIDISRVDLVREREPAWLGEASNLERELLPALGINDFVPEVFPRTCSLRSVEDCATTSIRSSSLRTWPS